jgi:hypothetical protein
MIDDGDQTIDREDQTIDREDQTIEGSSIERSTRTMT